MIADHLTNVCIAVSKSQCTTTVVNVLRIRASCLNINHSSRRLHCSDGFVAKQFLLHFFMVFQQMHCHIIRGHHFVLPNSNMNVYTYTGIMCSARYNLLKLQNFSVLVFCNLELLAAERFVSILSTCSFPTPVPVSNVCFYIFDFLSKSFFVFLFKIL